MNRRCPHEERETREGVWTGIVDYYFHCRCLNRENWNCDRYYCLCSERRAALVD